MISFAYPWVLTLLILPVAAFLYWRYLRRRPTLVLSSSRHFSGGAGRRIRYWPTIPEWCYLLAALLLVAAAARPRFGDEKLLLRARGIDIVLALDISGSMEAIDIPTGVSSGAELTRMLENGQLKNRLETAKEELSAFVARRANDRIGLVAFGEKPYNAAPPTLDHGFLIGQLKRLQPIDLISNRTGLAAPIASGVRRLQNSKAPRRVLVLFTDGRNNVDARLSPVQAAALAHDADVIVHTVGIGSARALVRNSFGQYGVVPGDFDEPGLREIAAAAGGSYFHAGDAEGMKNVMREIDALEKTVVEQPKYIEYREYAPNLALAGVVLLCLGFALECTISRRIP